MVTNFHARPDVKCSPNPARVVPFNASTAGSQGATQGSASVTSPPGVASGGSTQPPLQLPSPTLALQSNAQPQVTSMAPPSSASSVSTSLPSDSASVTNAALQVHTAQSGSIQRIGPSIYYQSMTGISGRSDSGFHPPTANMAMVKRPSAPTVMISSGTTSVGDFSEIEVVEDFSEIQVEDFSEIQEVMEPECIEQEATFPHIVSAN